MAAVPFFGMPETWSYIEHPTRITFLCLESKMSIVITCGNVRCELPVADLFITLPSGYKGNLKIKQEEENVITLDCDSIITIKEEDDIMIVEPFVPIVPPVITAVPIPQAQAQPLRIRTPPLPESPVLQSLRSPVVAYGLSPSPIPFACPNSPHDIPELFDTASQIPELAPPSLVETAPVNQKTIRDRLIPGKTGRINKKKDRNLENYIAEGTEITHSVTGGPRQSYTCISTYFKKYDYESQDVRDTFLIRRCEAVPSLIHRSFHSLTAVCKAFASALVDAGIRPEDKNAAYNGWDNSRVMRNGKLVKLSKIRDEANEDA